MKYKKMKKVDVKDFIRFLKDDGIYQYTINGIKKYKEKHKYNNKNIMKLIEDNFFFGGSCDAFFVWVCYWNNENFDVAHKYSNDFELYLDKIKKN